MSAVQIDTRLSLRGTAAAGSYVRMYCTADGAEWLVQKPDGTFLDTTGSKSQGLQEAIDYAVLNGCPLAVNGYAYTQPAGHCATLCATETLTVPPTLQQSMRFDNLVLACYPADGGPGMVFDTAEVLEFSFGGLVLYQGNDYAARFSPQHANVPDGALAIDISKYRFNVVGVQNVAGTEPKGAVLFDASAGDIKDNILVFREIGGDDSSGGPFAGYGIMVPCPSASKFFENNHITAQLIHGFTAAGVQVGNTTTNQANLRANMWTIHTIQSDGHCADGFNSFGSNDTGNVSVSARTGSFDRAFVFEPGSGGNFLLAREATGTIYTNAGAATNRLLHNGVWYP